MILYIGSSGSLSLTPFKALLASDYPVAAVGVYHPTIFKGKIISIETPDHNESLAFVANQCSIPVIDLSAPIADVLKRCRDYSIDTIIISCYAKRLPARLIQMATNGCINCHPSLLPAFGGPEPIFWQMKSQSDMGVSWHQVTSEFDSGDIVAKRSCMLADGLNYREICHQLAKMAADLLLEMVSKECFSGRSDALKKGVKQIQTKMSYQHYPQKKDFVIDPVWSVRRAYNFMRATEIFSYAYLYVVENKPIWLGKAISYDENHRLNKIQVKANILSIPFNEGVLIATQVE